VNDQLLPPRVVRQLLGGLSAPGLHRLDHELQPERDAFGNRLYKPAAVSELIARRAQRRNRP
jgi:hypothetical protein